MCPASGASAPEIWWISVVLPAPFGPMMACVSPGSTSRLRRSVTLSAPNDLSIARGAGRDRSSPPPARDGPGDAAVGDQHQRHQRPAERHVPPPPAGGSLRQASPSERRPLSSSCWPSPQSAPAADGASAGRARGASTLARSRATLSSPRRQRSTAPAMPPRPNSTSSTSSGPRITFQCSVRRERLSSSSRIGERAEDRRRTACRCRPAAPSRSARPSAASACRRG